MIQEHLRCIARHQRKATMWERYRSLNKVATISAVVKPVTDSVSVELYGERIHGMLTIATTDKYTLKAGDIVRCDGADYKILSVAHYTMHDSATAERT